MAAGKDTHAVMKSSLARALIEAGVQHHDFGGFVGSTLGNIIGGPLKGIAGGLTTSNDYSASLAPTTQTNYSPTINQSQTNALAVNPQQQALAQVLLQQSQGNGPNPAQAALNQATGNNVAQTGALIASQRGASANPGQMAKLAAMQGANIQQQASGQAATLQAQQQIAAQQQLQNLYGQQATQANQLFGEAAQAQNAQNMGQVQNYAQMQGINSGVSAGNAGATNAIVGGILNGGAAAGAAALKGAAYEGGEMGEDGSILHAEEGAEVPGQAAHPGNDIRNDVVPALLSKGEVVLPNSVTQSADPVKKAAEFMAHLKGEKTSASSYDKVAQAKKSLKERVEQLEKMCMGGKA